MKTVPTADVRKRVPSAAPRSVILSHLSGWPGLLLVGAVLVAYGALALAPFRWAPPRRLINAAIVDANGIRFPAAGLAYTPEPPEWLGRAAMLESFRLQLRFRPYSLEEYGPTRIFTISRDLHLANLSVGQDGADLVLRVRRPGSTPNGKPAYRMPGVLRHAGWHDVEVVIASGTLRVTVDRRLALETMLPQHALTAWNRGHLVALGSELNGLFHWRGEVSRAVVDIDGESTDYASQDSALVLPDTFWRFANRPTWLLPDEIDRDSFKDWAANFVSFVPLGFLLGALRGTQGSWRRALALCALVSLVVEVAQVFFSRHPASMDWVLNTLGGGLGAAMARWLLGQRLTMTRTSLGRMTLAVAILALGIQFNLTTSALLRGVSPAEAHHAPIEGFAAATAGGAGQPDCVVRSLDDGGPGTLRECLSRGSRHVKFSVAGTIDLAGQLNIQSPFVTVDGSTAPSPGITLRRFGLTISDQHDVIVRGLRIRDAGTGSSRESSIDCIGMKGRGTYNIAIDHVSIHNCGDGGIDISAGPRNITIQWSIVSTSKAMLWGSTSGSPSKSTDRISMHHTALICGRTSPIEGVAVGCDRFPLIRANGYPLTADVRRNIFFGWLRANGTKIEPAALVNVVGNAYIPAAQSTFSQRQGSIAVAPGTRVYTAHNVELGAPPRPDLNDNGNDSRPMSTPPIRERSLGCVVRDAGMHPRDAVDQTLLSFVRQVPEGCADADRVGSSNN